MTTMKSRLSAWLVVPLASLAALACAKRVDPEVTRDFQGRSLFLCCNLHHEADELTDANYFIGRTIPAGTPLSIDEVTRQSATFTAGGKKLTIVHQYGVKEESVRQYVAKVFVPNDPRERIARWPADVRDATRSGRVEVGMTKEQVIVSLGYPPTHSTPSIQDREWTYWYNRWVTYKVLFDDGGRVRDVIGSPAPTNRKAIVQSRPKVETREAPPLRKRSGE